jgi:Bacterial Ig domain
MSVRTSTLLIALCLAANSARAAATYAQNFDNVAGGTAALTSQGFLFRDQSSAAAAPWYTSGWVVQPSFSGFPSQAGAGNLTFESTGNAQSSLAVSAWVVLPPIPNLAAGDILEFYVRGFSFQSWTGNGALEVRYAANGGTSTGSTSSSLGDFTTLLKSIQPTEGAPYTSHQTVIPGTGRIALRVVAPNVPVFGYTPYLQLDTLRFNPPPPPYPLPAPGQTVIWTMAMSPITINSDVTIQAGGTVIVDPGVEVRIAQSVTLAIAGTLDARGGAIAPVRFTRLGTVGELKPFAESTLKLAHTIVDCRIHPNHGATLLASDCAFTPNGNVDNAFDAYIDPRRSIVRLDRCVFTGASLQLEQVVAALRDVDFVQQTNISDVLLLGYVLLDDVTVDGTALWLGKERGLQPVFVDDVTVRNSSIHGGLLLMLGTDFQLGPNNVLQNNLWPVEFGARNAGLLPGSIIPTSGNVNNYVVDTDDWDPQTTVTRSPLAVPYVVRNFRFLGHERYLPGTRIQFMPGTSYTVDAFGMLDAQGTEEQPIVFEPFLAGQSWNGLALFHDNRNQRLEHCVFRGANVAVVAHDARIDSCLFENNVTGLFVSKAEWVEVQSSRFTGNQTGAAASLDLFAPGALLLKGSTNPNSIAGNAIGAIFGSSVLPSTGVGNWWGHPSGPKHNTQNPSGLGDLVQGPASIPLKPFLTAPPDPTDSPPHVVVLDGLGFVTEPGNTLLLSWTAEDDGAIVSQRLLFSPNSDYPGAFQVVSTPLSATQRTLAFTVPTVGFQVNGENAFLRIESVDDRGQVGYDDLELSILDPSVAGDLTITADLTGPFEPGVAFDLTFTTNGVNPAIAPSVNGFLFLDGDGEALSLGGVTYSLGSINGTLVMPEVSTDRARVGLYFAASLNRQKWFFSDSFAIRPSTVLGDAPPTVTMTSPQNGDSFLASLPIPIRWQASDDEGIRGFDIVASTDGGRRFTRVANGLTSGTTAYDWRLPEGIAFEDLRIRVIARDLRYQNSADDVQCRIVAPNACQANLGLGSAGGPVLAICGAPLATGQLATLTLTGAPPSQPGYLFVSTTLAATPFLGGILATLPIALALPIVTNSGGHLSMANVPGGNGPVSIYLQAIVAAPQHPKGALLSNALRLDFLP